MRWLRDSASRFWSRIQPDCACYKTPTETVQHSNTGNCQRYLFFHRAARGMNQRGLVRRCHSPRYRPDPRCGRSRLPLSIQFVLETQSGIPMTFEAYLWSRSAGKETLATSAVWIRAMLGQDLRDISALWFIAYCKAGGGLLQMRSDRKGGGQHLRIRQGMQMISKVIAETLPQDVVCLARGQRHSRAQSRG